MIGAKDMSTSEAQKRAVAKYDEGKELVKFRVVKGRKKLYMELAKRNNKSLTAYITDLLEEKLKEEQ